MLMIIVDMVILWLLLNIFSDHNWDDEKLKIFGIVLAISILGGVAANVAASYVDPFTSLGVYFFVGTVCLWGLASLTFGKSAAAMGVFTGYKLALGLIIMLAFS